MVSSVWVLAVAVNLCATVRGRAVLILGPFCTPIRASEWDLEPPSCLLCCSSSSSGSLPGLEFLKRKYVQDYWSLSVSFSWHNWSPSTAVHQILSLRKWWLSGRCRYCHIPSVSEWRRGRCASQTVACCHPAIHSYLLFCPLAQKSFGESYRENMPIGIKINYPVGEGLVCSTIWKK